MANKNLFKISAVALLGVIGLTACSDDIKAEYANYESPVVVNTNGDAADIYNNCLDSIYDAYRDGSLASDVLNEVLYQYSISVFGRYNKRIAGSEVTLKEAVKDLQVDAEGNVTGGTVASQFINDHKAYQTLDSEGERKTDAESQAREFARLYAKWNTIEDRIAEIMYGKISTGSYSYRNLFSEVKFVRSLQASLKKVSSTIATNYSEILLDPSVEAVDVFEEFLTRANFQREYDLEDDESAPSDVTYIEDEVIPEIYRQLLVEQYITDKSYTSLGRSYARKVNIIKISKNNDYKRAASELMNYFINNVVSATPNATTLEDATNLVTLDDFKALSTAWKGVIDYNAEAGSIDAKAKTALDAVLATGAITKETINGQEVYLGTDYGTLMEDYKEITINNGVYTCDDEDIWNSFTNSGKYPVETGLKIKTDEVLLKDYVTNGWFIKSGLSSIPSAILTQLFDTNLATELDKATDRFEYNGGAWTSSKKRDNTQTPNIAKINNSYFLKKTETEPTADDNNSDILFYDSDSYYVVQIEFAVSPAKFNRTVDPEKAKIKPYETALMEENINEVNKIISSEESQVKLAKQYWLEQMALEYHDTTIYDFFKANYPDLFEDKD